jgi:hypothetical protein
MPRRRKRPVKRARDTAGEQLPTAKEVAFVRAIAGHLGFALPVRFERNHAFVRLFLATFSYAGSDAPPKDEIVRRCRVARLFAAEGRSAEDLAQKFDLSPAQAALLLDYGRQKVPRHWTHTAESSEAAPLDAFEDAPDREPAALDDPAEVAPEPDLDALLERLPERVGDDL